MQTEHNGSGLRELVVSLLVPMAAMSAVCWLVSLIWGFSLPALIGFCLGYGYVVFCCFYLASSCEKAVELDVKRGKRVMLTCYAVRFAGLFALCAFSMLTGYINVYGVLLPQFFPRIVLTVTEFRRSKKKTQISDERKDGA